MSAARKAAGLVSTVGGAVTGIDPSASCLPVLTVAKSTTTPTVTLPGGTTAQYVINVSNATTAGAAYGVSLSDVLPLPFGLRSVVTGDKSVAGEN